MFVNLNHTPHSLYGSHGDMPFEFKREVSWQHLHSGSLQLSSHAYALPDYSWPRIQPSWLPEMDYVCPVWSPEKQSLFWDPHQLPRAFSEVHQSLRVFILHPSVFHSVSDLHCRLDALPAYSKTLTQQFFCRIEFCKWFCGVIRLRTPIILIGSANYLSKRLYQCILPLIVW